MPGSLLLLLLGACATHAPRKVPALEAAAGPVAQVALPEGAPVQLALRAGSAYDPPGREGLAWVTAHAVAAEAGAEVEVGAEIVLFRFPGEGASRLAQALATAPTEPRVDAARRAAAEALGALGCTEMAARAWDAWVYGGHPYGHAPEGRTSVLPTITAAEVAAFTATRYVRSVAVLGVPAGGAVDSAAFDALPPRLSRSPVPATLPPLPEARVLVVRGGAGRCVAAGHPAAAGGTVDAVGASMAAGEPLAQARRQPRRLVALPIAEGQAAAEVLAAFRAGAWLPLVAAGPLAPPVDPFGRQALVDALLAQDPWPSLARPLREAPSAPVASAAPDASVRGAASAPGLDAALLSGWLDTERSRYLLVLPPEDSLSLESLGLPVVEGESTFQELVQ